MFGKLIVPVITLFVSSLTAQIVDMDESFRIPQSEAGAISHTPSVVYTPDGKRMVTATSNGEVIVFETGTQKILRRVEFPGELSDAVSIDARARYAVWARAKGGLAVMDLETGKLLAENDDIRARWVAMSPDAGLIAVSNGEKCELRDTRSLQVLRELSGHEAEITAVEWSADGGLLGSTAQDGRILVHDAGTGEVRYTVKKGAPLYTVAFHPENTTIAYGGKANEVYQYHFAGEKEEVISKDQPFWITALGYSPDGEVLAVGDESCDIWLYKVKTRDRFFHNKHHVECWLSSVSWSPDNETFLFGCRPNSHAGTPSLHQPLAQLEAGRSEAMRVSRQAVLDLIDARLPGAGSEGERKALEACRESLEAESSLQQAAANYLTQQVAGNVMTVNYQETVDQLGNLRMGLNLEGVPEDIANKVKEHREQLQQEVVRLQSSFCVNQWKVVKEEDRDQR